MGSAARSHAELMDGVYRHQRHIYDLTRKYYLLGRDRLIQNLDAPPGAAVLEIGCGTGRNLIAAATRHPDATYYGIDISEQMLVTARSAISSAFLDDQITVAIGDATAFDAEALFGRARFERVFLSYAVSMIPDWEKAVALAADALALGGSLHVVDFGQQERMPRWFRSGLRAWLRKFHVEPRAMLASELAVQAERIGAKLSFTPLYRGYAWHIVVKRPATVKNIYSEKTPESASIIA